MKRLTDAVALFFLLVLFASPALAGLVIDSTRIIYPSTSRDVSIRLSNDTPEPLLVQVWIDDGDSRIAPRDAKSPFVVTTPIFRMEPAMQQAVRILFNGSGYTSLPTDRESVFWFNALEIPPVTDDIKERNHLQIAFRNRLKLFYRPTALASGAQEAPTNSRWQVRQTAKGPTVSVENTSPYYLSFSRLLYQDSGKPVAGLDGGMVAPFSKAEFPLEQLPATNRPASSNAASHLIVTLINDWGANQDYQAGQDGKLKRLPTTNAN